MRKVDFVSEIPPKKRAPVRLDCAAMFQRTVQINPIGKEETVRILVGGSFMSSRLWVLHRPGLCIYICIRTKFPEDIWSRRRAYSNCLVSASGERGGDKWPVDWRAHVVSRTGPGKPCQMGFRRSGHACPLHACSDSASDKGYDDSGW